MRKKPKPAATSATAPVARVEVDAAPGAAPDLAEGEALAAEPVAAAPLEPDEEPEAERAAERDETALEMALEMLETDEPETVADAVDAAAPEAVK